MYHIHLLYFCQDFINRRKLTEFGNLGLVEEREENEGGNITLRLPGVRKGDLASRSMKPEIRVYSLQFSPTGMNSNCLLLIHNRGYIYFFNFIFVYLRSSMVCGNNRRFINLFIGCWISIRPIRT